jgi:membrane associated rhomboid family serine protease
MFSNNQYGRNHYQRRGGGRHSTGPSTNPFFYYILYQAYQKYQSVPNKPQGTVVIIAIMFVYYFELVPLLNDFVIGKVSEACFSPIKIVRDFELKRLLFSAFIHADDMHLAYNVSSLLSKGIVLERRREYENEKFVILFCLVSILTHGIAALIATAFNFIGLFDEVYYNATYGTAGVLFALQTISLGVNPGGNYSFFGMNVPAKRIALTEIVFMYFMNPSMLNLVVHASGIFSGMFVLRFNSNFGSSYSISAISTQIVKMLKYFFGFNLATTTSTRARRTQNSNDVVGKRCALTGLEGNQSFANGTWGKITQRQRLGNNVDVYTIKLDDLSRDIISVKRENIIAI